MLTVQALQVAHTVKTAVQDIGSSPLNDDGTVKGEDTDMLQEKVKPGVMDIVGVTGLASSATTLILTTGHVVTLASYVTAALAPYAAYQTRKLKALGGMRGEQNTLRQCTNEFMEQNSILTESIDKLEGQVTALEGVEATLSEIATKSNTSVIKLTELVKRNGEIQKQIKVNLERQVLSDIVSIVVSTDRNQDFCLQEAEMTMLMVRLRGQRGVEFDEANFTKLVGKPPCTLANILKVIRNLMDDTVPEEENVFHLKPRELLIEGLE